MGNCSFRFKFRKFARSEENSHPEKEMTRKELTNTAVGEVPYPEETPSFNFKMSFQSNLAFMVALFMLACSLAWVLRDHRRRLLELASEEQEDRLYLTILGILFIICLFGSFFAFNRHYVQAGGKITSQNAIIAEIQHSFGIVKSKFDTSQEQTSPPYSPDADVVMPIPTVKKLNERIKMGRLDPADKYQGLSFLCFFCVILLAVWYFYPRKTHEITKPPDYIDAKGTRA